MMSSASGNCSANRLDPLSRGRLARYRPTTHGARIKPPAAAIHGRSESSAQDEADDGGGDQGRQRESGPGHSQARLDKEIVQLSSARDCRNR